MLRPCLAVLIAALSLYAEVIGPIRNPPLPPALVQYLELTAEQSTAIGKLNADLASLTLQKSQRAAQVQIEIAQETAKETLDAMALGVRYLELEAIRRDLTVQQKQTAAEIQKLLTTAQKGKLSVLQEALRLNSTACEAVSLNLISAPPVAFTGGIPMLSSGIIAGSILSPMCLPLGVRTGDFSSISVFTPGRP